MYVLFLPEIYYNLIFASSESILECVRHKLLYLRNLKTNTVYNLKRNSANS